jgi:SAM-dependent methyltransferase
VSPPAASRHRSDDRSGDAAPLGGAAVDRADVDRAAVERPDVERAVVGGVGVDRVAAEGAERERFLARLRSALERRTLLRLVLSAPRTAGSDVVRISVRPVVLRGREQLSVVSSHARRDETRNLGVAEALALVDAQLGPVFGHAHLHATDVEVELRRSRKGRWALVREAPALQAKASGAQAPALAPPRAAPLHEPAAAPVVAAAPPASMIAPPVVAAAPHDRAKRRWVDIGRPWLAALGVTDAEGRLVPAMARKWKQINKFVEVFDHAWHEAAPALDRPVRVVDFGAGKGYLTFALAEHLTRALGLRAEVIGVELRADLVAQAEAAARQTGLEGLRFIEGDVRTHAPESIDVMIALHACDTATDHALHAGVRAGAAIILAAPCCHRELRPQMLLPAALKPVLQHGIHLGQEAEMVTDGLRALLLEADGYATQVFEFVALEHTRKNKMILAVRRRRPVERGAIEAQIAAIKAFYGIRAHTLEALLAADRSESLAAGSTAPHASLVRA